MPIYEYECPCCGEKFELRRGITDTDSEIRCPKCGAEDQRRLFSTFAMSSSGEVCPPSSPT